MTRALITAAGVGIGIGLVAAALAGYALRAFARALDRLDTVDD